MKSVYRPDKFRVENGDWKRASGDCICQICSFDYYAHQPVIGFTWLRKLCDGKLVKL